MALRVTTICSKKIDFLKHFAKMKSLFLVWGYPKDLEMKKSSLPQKVGILRETNR